MDFWRKCVFCGHSTKVRTKEHLIPSWLQKFAGNEKVPASISHPSGTTTLHWSSLTLPACQVCNAKYSLLENSAKQAFQQIEDGYIASEKISDLLDWMDKIRIGYWLLALTHGRTSHSIKPNFSIDERIGKADRLLRIIRYPTDAKGIALIGSDTGAFYRMPSAITLIVKGIAILSISAGGFLHEEMGLSKFRSVLDRGSPRDDLVVSELTGEFNANWHYDLLRLRQQRFFSFFNLAESSDRPNGSTFTDMNGRLDRISADSIFQLETTPKLGALLKFELNIEVYEVQRTLLKRFSRFKLSERMRHQLKRDYSELDSKIDHLIEVYNSVAPIPIYRRTFLRVRTHNQ